MDDLRICAVIAVSTLAICLALLGVTLNLHGIATAIETCQKGTP